MGEEGTRFGGWDWGTLVSSSVPGSCWLLAPRQQTYRTAEDVLGKQAKLRSGWFSSILQVFLRTQNFSGQRAMFPTAAVPGRFLCEEQMSGPCCLGVKSPCYRQAEGTCSWHLPLSLGGGRVVLGSSSHGPRTY